ncbi:hypothetical protein CONCODRAFT_5369 [Conidiobolus coronatus NRRL 28638]|uniref:Uncharacterized protein n=1 Tax=Conidiobolus coronatus (strain ATCC 28846 / CBS 209.66 / NRRL 28638) TaxID=796925 RepID=A0A137PA15_CONC2|nr:hypothetical protein CONCODRAFT_5369 [Conidiobolus coronatus NRRL 28638]|eukprot:KXN71845.1 hypothetical protein CONCODRAFT_5369 [Conidiobolus coronatus NRRL 28638]
MIGADGLLHLKMDRLDIVSCRPDEIDNFNSSETDRQNKIISSCFYTFFTMSLISLGIIILSNINNREFSVVPELRHVTEIIAYTNRFGSLVILPICIFNWIKSFRSGNHWSLLPTMALFLFFQFALINLYTFNRVAFVKYLQLNQVEAYCKMESPIAPATLFAISSYVPKYHCLLEYPFFQAQFDSFSTFSIYHFFPSLSGQILNSSQLFEHMYILDLLSISYSITLLLTIIILGSLYCMVDLSKSKNTLSYDLKSISIN